MGTIQTTVGLITGIDIKGLVDQLIEISARPKTMLEERNKTLQEQQTALGTLAGLLYSVKMAATNLAKTETYQQSQVTSSNSDILAATKTGTPALGLYELTPIRMAQSHKLISSGFRSAQEALGLSGTMTIRFGDHVERGLSLSLVNGGAGIQRGKIRIVDRSGDWADIDLSTAQTIDDVLDAINSNTSVNVLASVRDGRIRLEDQTGQTVSNLKVLEVGGGRTAESLGLDGIDVAASSAEGDDILRLFEDLDLNVLNDGAGISISTSLPEISYTLRDGSKGQINFASGGTREVTLGEILQKIEEQSGGKIQADIGPDGRRLVLTDTTTGAGSFTLTALYGSKTLADLGLDTGAVDGVITGKRILSGLRTVSLRSLNGGSGLGQLGLLSLTDRSGASDVVDLSNAETLEDVVEAINGSSVSIVARVNSARNGIELEDTSGSTASNLIVANGDATNTADKLQIAVNAAVHSVNSGDLHLRIISQNTLLSTLNGGGGVAKGQFYIKDSSGRTTTIDLRSSNIQTIGDVIRTINTKTL
ncbi:MAG TPA: flagellar cap protein FliD N-terminal domain-containing protein, partial [Thermoguttaceae bacterium]|nr:flagellar cap protein FliD N-terminal domain-containing protein [Thermoguttaceae bacterium]